MKTLKELNLEIAAFKALPYLERVAILKQTDKRFIIKRSAREYGGWVSEDIGYTQIIVPEMYYDGIKWEGWVDFTTDPREAHYMTQKIAEEVISGKGRWQHACVAGHAFEIIDGIELGLQWEADKF